MVFWMPAILEKPPFGLPGAGRPRQHLLDFHRDPVAVHRAPRRWRSADCLASTLTSSCLGSVQFDDGAAAEPHNLMNRHRSGPEHHHEVDR